MTSKDRASYLEFAKGLAQEAGVIMKRYFRADDIATEWKEDNSPITIADKTINSLVIERVKEAFPEHGVLGEEESFEPNRKRVWIVDPIDGTSPYSLGMPLSTFCLALVDEGRVQVSVVYDPVLDRLYSASLGEGATVNDQQLKVSDKNTFDQAYTMGFSGLGPRQEPLEPIIEAIRSKGGRVISVPSFSYMAAHVATGDLVLCYMAYGSPWDAAAISLIVEEAGGKVTDMYGKERTYPEWGEGLLVSNGSVLHDDVLEMIRNANPRD